MAAAYLRSMRHKLPVVFMHLVFWLAMYWVPVLTLSVQGPPGGPDGRFYWFDLLFFGSQIGFFYLNYAVLVPRVYLRGRWLRYAIWSAACLILWVWILKAEVSLGRRPPMLPPPPPRSNEAAALPEFGPPNGDNQLELSRLFTFGLVWLASAGLRLSAEYAQADKRRREAENASLRAELGQLKSQINPHFLFNTLNGLQALALENGALAADAIHRLGSLLRYAIEEINADMVPLERDIEHLSHFIELHKMRLPSAAEIHFHLEGDPAGHRIAPLLLVPFVENALKYGISAEARSRVDILLKINDLGQLLFECSNQIFRREPGTGIGIANARRRLELLYPGKHSLKIGERGGHFQVRLQVETHTPKHETA